MKSRMNAVKATTYYINLTDELRIEADSHEEPGVVGFYLVRKNYGDKYYLYGIRAEDPKKALEDSLSVFLDYNWMSPSLEKILEGEEIDPITYEITKE